MNSRLFKVEYSIFKKFLTSLYVNVNARGCPIICHFCPVIMSNKSINIPGQHLGEDNLVLFGSSTLIASNVVAMTLLKQLQRLFITRCAPDD